MSNSPKGFTLEIKIEEAIDRTNLLRISGTANPCVLNIHEKGQQILQQITFRGNTTQTLS